MADWEHSSEAALLPEHSKSLERFADLLLLFLVRVVLVELGGDSFAVGAWKETEVIGKVGVTGKARALLLAAIWELERIERLAATRVLATMRASDFETQAECLFGQDAAVEKRDGEAADLQKDLFLEDC